MAAETVPADHAKQVETWRQGRIARLKSDEGWLTVAGLFWLKEGKTAFGSAANAAVKLPAHSAPAQAGWLTRKEKTVTIEPAAGVTLTIAGKPVTAGQALKADDPGPPDVVSLGDLRFFVIERDGEIGIRLRDLRSDQRTKFAGIESFPVRPEYRVKARFVPHPPGAKASIDVPNVLGKSSEMKSPGKVVFSLGGAERSLTAVLEQPSDKRLFLIFKDQTAGKETYGAGRFVYTESLPEQGHVIVDFNKAYNPPCAFTAFATCPLPPPENRLRLRIEAGEKRVAGH